MQSRQLKLNHLIILLCLSVFAFSTHSTAQEKDGLLKIYFFDVGQGDSIFIETPSGYQILVDGGPGNTILSRLGEVIPFYDKDIDIVVMTHPDADHASGLVEVLERYEVENIVYSDIVNDKDLYQSWGEAVIEENANVINPVNGLVIDLSDGVTLTTIYPFESLAGQEIKKVNDISTVVMLEYGELEVLLTGDIELKTERQLLLKELNIDADVLKVAHHGSKTSSMEEFLSAVSPEVAIIQVGADNRYSHPAEEVLDRIEKYGIKMYRNDLDGTIRLFSDGLDYRIVTQK